MFRTIAFFTCDAVTSFSYLHLFLMDIPFLTAVYFACRYIFFKCCPLLSYRYILYPAGYILFLPLFPFLSAISLSYRCILLLTVISFFWPLCPILTAISFSHRYTNFLPLDPLLTVIILSYREILFLPPYPFRTVISRAVIGQHFTTNN